MSIPVIPLRYARVPEQLSCELEQEIAILDLKSKLYFGLTGVGATIWQELERPKSIEELVTSVQAKYQVEADQCRADVASFLDSLLARGLLQVEERPE